MPQQAEEKYDKHYHRVVYTEVIKIALEPRGEFAVRDGIGGWTGEELEPRPACGVDQLHP